MVTDTTTLLKPVEDNHVEAAFQLIDKNRQFLSEWIGWAENHQSIEDTLYMIQNGISRFTRKQGIMAGIWYRDQLIGMAQHTYVDKENETAGVCIWLGEDYQGRGLAKSALRSFIRYSFNHLNFERLEFRCTSNNMRAIQLVEKIGFVREGTLFKASKIKGQRYDAATYGLLREDWQ
jgi:ribosomal-protein-serine acetyltransferase